MAVKISIDGEKLSYECETTLVKAAQVIAFLSSSEENDLTGEASAMNAMTLLPSTSVLGQNQSPREAIIESKAKTNPQKIVVLGSYLKKLFGNSTFTPIEIRQLFDRAGEPTPKNFSRDLKDAIRLGYIFESSTETGKYLLSNRGESMVVDGFSNDELNKQSKNKGRLKKTGSDLKRIREQIKELQLSSSVEDWQPFHSLDTKAKKIVWLIAFADKSEITELTSSEIAYLADKLRTTIPAKNVYSATQDSIRKDYITEVSGKYKIRQKGLELIHEEG